MIYNERQLKITVAELQKLLDARAAIIEQSDAAEAWLREAQRVALSSQIEELEQEIAEYKLLRDGKVSA